MSLVAGDALVVDGVLLVPVFDVSVCGVAVCGRLTVVASSAPVAIVVRTADGDHALDVRDGQASLADLLATPGLGERLAAATDRQEARLNAGRVMSFAALDS